MVKINKVGLAVTTAVAILGASVGLALEAARIIPSPLGIIVGVSILGVGLALERRYKLI